jgi:hypothetical protein
MEIPAGDHIRETAMALIFELEEVAYDPDDGPSRKPSFGFLIPSSMNAFTPMLGHLENVG